eukprot:COSAG06_NODE_36706_length_443_cov_27.184502_1_plen_53_part_10
MPWNAHAQMRHVWRLKWACVHLVAVRARGLHAGHLLSALLYMMVEPPKQTHLT